MEWKNVGEAVAKFAPIVGAVLGGPPGAAIGGLLAKSIGVESTPDAVLKAIAGNPDMELKVKAFEIRHKEHLEKMELERLAIETGDMQQARTVHANHWMPSVLTFLLAVMVSVLTGMLFFLTVPAESRDLLVSVTGQITSLFVTSVAYWIGTSRSSFVKDQRLAEK